MINREEFDSMIGRLDRCLSEILIFAKRSDLDLADAQTIKHHSDDLRGVAEALDRKLDDGNFSLLEVKEKL